MTCGPRTTISPVSPGGRSSSPVSMSTILSSVSANSTPLLSSLMRGGAGFRQAVPLNNAKAEAGFHAASHVGRERRRRAECVFDRSELRSFQPRRVGEREQGRRHGEEPRYAMLLDQPNNSLEVEAF